MGRRKYKREYYSALRRKEAFATSGPRIKVRFFAGYDFDNEMINDSELVKHLYEKGHSMGSDILNTSKSQILNSFMDITRCCDPLQRLQIIKGFVEDGELKEIVFDVACSDGLQVNEENYRCPDNGAEVNIKDCSFDSSVGASELKAFWKDPTYETGQRAFYYVRVLENPTCRWSTWDSIRNNVEPSQTIQLQFKKSLVVANSSIALINERHKRNTCFSNRHSFSFY